MFSATGHGKGACDGVGGLVKHYASDHNLKSKPEDSIRNVEDFAKHVKSYTSAISILVLPESDLAKFGKEKLSEWEKSAKKIENIQKLHFWKKKNMAKFTKLELNNMNYRKTNKKTAFFVNNNFFQFWIYLSGFLINFSITTVIIIKIIYDSQIEYKLGVMIFSHLAQFHIFKILL